ncbi:hypothetical protein FTUN_2614 [Frigoriglobus tundricola]|uniref:Uncharacterized protein n=1 Tax=Frigoriglobus tundricola TaxID=2774151 RepID=A0A6M5YME0_9BACT|nr:hypothetical protein FTUN_2614 [Frigoriglobus tundricola]
MAPQPPTATSERTSSIGRILIAVYTIRAIRATRPSAGPETKKTGQPVAAGAAHGAPAFPFIHFGFLRAVTRQTHAFGPWVLIRLL